MHIEPAVFRILPSQSNPESRETLTHILFMIDELCEMGGAERVLLKMIRRLPRSVFRCSLITFKIDEASKELKEIPCPVYVLPLRKTYGLGAFRTAAQIRRFIHQEHVSIVHTFFETSDLWGGMVAKFSRAPVLVSSRRDMGILRKRKHRLAYRCMAPFYDAVLTVSSEVRKFCISADGLNPARVHTLFNGLELGRANQAITRSRMRSKNRIPEEVPVITTVANVRRIKGIDLLVRVAALVCRKHPEAIFLVVGQKSERDYCCDLERKIQSLGLSANVHFLGAREDVYSILNMSDVFCLPSRSEGFSNALIEAMASRLPCVATDVGGNREALVHGMNGFIVPSNEVGQMASKILYLLDHPEIAREMGRRGREIVERSFTAEAMMERLVKIYDELLKAKGHRQ